MHVYPDVTPLYQLSLIGVHTTGIKRENYEKYNHVFTSWSCIFIIRC